MKRSTISIIISLLMLSGCGEVPECSDDQTKKLVIQSLIKNIDDAGKKKIVEEDEVAAILKGLDVKWIASNFIPNLSMVREISVDKESGARKCSADLEISPTQETLSNLDSTFEKIKSNREILYAGISALITEQSLKQKYGDVTEDQISALLKPLSQTLALDTYAVLLGQRNPGNPQQLAEYVEELKNSNYLSQDVKNLFLYDIVKKYPKLDSTAFYKLKSEATGITKYISVLGSTKATSKSNITYSSEKQKIDGSIQHLVTLKPTSDDNVLGYYMLNRIVTEGLKQIEIISKQSSLNANSSAQTSVSTNAIESVSVKNQSTSQPNTTSTQMNTEVVKNSDVKPSFDCAKATSTQEKLICSDSVLAEADNRLSVVYKTALEQSSEKAALKKSQIDWIKSERGACETAKCVLHAIEQRTHELADNH